MPPTGPPDDLLPSARRAQEEDHDKKPCRVHSYSSSEETAQDEVLQNGGKEAASTHHRNPNGVHTASSSKPRKTRRLLPMIEMLPLEEIEPVSHLPDTHSRKSSRDELRPSSSPSIPSSTSDKNARPNSLNGHHEKADKSLSGRPKAKSRRILRSSSPSSLSSSSPVWNASAPLRRTHPSSSHSAESAKPAEPRIPVIKFRISTKKATRPPVEDPPAKSTPSPDKVPPPAESLIEDLIEPVDFLPSLPPASRTDGNLLDEAAPSDSSESSSPPPSPPPPTVQDPPRKMPQDWQNARPPLRRTDAQGALRPPLRRTNPQDPLSRAMRTPLRRTNMVDPFRDDSWRRPPPRRTDDWARRRPPNGWRRERPPLRRAEDGRQVRPPLDRADDWGRARPPISPPARAPAVYRPTPPAPPPFASPSPTTPSPVPMAFRRRVPARAPVPLSRFGQPRARPPKRRQPPANSGPKRRRGDGLESVWDALQRRKASAHLPRPRIASAPQARKFVCGACGQALVSAANLKRHVANRHGAKVACPEPGCGMKFKDGPAVAAHVRAMHSGEAAGGAGGGARGGFFSERRSFACPEPGCKRVFSRPTDVAAHVVAAHGDDDVDPANVDLGVEAPALQDGAPAKVSSGAAPVRRALNGIPVASVVCVQPGCGKTFKSKRALNLHIGKEHPELLPFKCPTCSKGFPKRPDLRKHLHNVHGVETEFDCGEPGCNLTFATAANRTRHRLKVHGVP